MADAAATLPRLPVRWLRWEERERAGDPGRTVDGAIGHGAPDGNDRWSLLLAPAGAGKSFALLELDQHLTKNGWRVVRIALRGDTLDRHLAGRVLGRTPDDQRPVAVLLDAIDESGQAEAQFGNDIRVMLGRGVEAVCVTARDWMAPRLGDLEAQFENHFGKKSGRRWTLAACSAADVRQAFDGDDHSAQWRALAPYLGRDRGMETWITRPFWLERLLLASNPPSSAAFAASGATTLEGVLEPALDGSIGRAIKVLQRDDGTRAPSVHDVRVALERVALVSVLSGLAPTARDLETWGGTGDEPAAYEVVQVLERGGLLHRGDGGALRFDHAVTLEFGAASALRRAAVSPDATWSVLTVAVAGRRVLPSYYGGVAIWLADLDAAFACRFAVDAPMLALQSEAVAKPEIAALVVESLLAASDDDYGIGFDLPAVSVLRRLESPALLKSLVAEVRGGGGPSRSRTAAALLGSFRSPDAMAAATACALDGSIDDVTREVLVQRFVVDADRDRLAPLEVLTGAAAPGDGNGDIAGCVLYALVREGAWPAERLVGAMRSDRPGYSEWLWHARYLLVDVLLQGGDPAPIGAFLVRLADPQDLDESRMAARLVGPCLDRVADDRDDAIAAAVDRWLAKLVETGLDGRLRASIATALDVQQSRSEGVAAIVRWQCASTRWLVLLDRLACVVDGYSGGPPIAPREAWTAFDGLVEAITGLRIVAGADADAAAARKSALAALSDAVRGRIERRAAGEPSREWLDDVAKRLYAAKDRLLPASNFAPLAAESADVRKARAIERESIAVAQLRDLIATDADLKIGPDDLRHIGLPASESNVIVRLDPADQRRLAHGILRAPAPAEPKRGRVYAVDPGVWNWRRLRRGLVDAIADRAGDDDIAWLERAAEFADDKTWLRTLAGQARRQRAEQASDRLTPRDAIAWLAAAGHKRAIRSADDLLDVAVTALDDIQRQLADKGSAWHVLWGERRPDHTRRPKDEADLQVWLSTELERRLPTVAILREVEVAPRRAGLAGEAPDFVIIAQTSTGTPIAIYIEVKGSWNRDATTAMEIQLFDRYLIGGACRHGLYLLVYFGPSGWTADDRRRAESIRNFADADEARAKLERQAAKLDDPLGRRICAFVLDASQPA